MEKNGTAAQATTVSGADGGYDFTGIADGEYQIRVANPYPIDATKEDSRKFTLGAAGLYADTYKNNSDLSSAGTAEVTLPQKSRLRN